MNLLVKELIEAYPEAKVILTTRDPAKWRKSIENSILIIDKWRVWGYLPLISPDCAAFIKMMHKMDEVMDGYSIAALNRHNAGIREVVPEENCLSLRWVRMDGKSSANSSSYRSRKASFRM